MAPKRRSNPSPTRRTPPSPRAKVAAKSSAKPRRDSPPRDAKEVIRCFKQFDSNCNGTIDRQDLEQALAKCSPDAQYDFEQIFDAADANKDGFIDYEEFCRWVFEDAVGSKVLHNVEIGTTDEAQNNSNALNNNLEESGLPDWMTVSWAEKDPFSDVTGPPEMLKTELQERSNSPNRKDVNAMKALLDAQDDKLASIIKELEKGPKKGHWIWYVFPTSMAGACDDRGTYVTRSTMSSLFENATREKKWQRALELICDQVEEAGVKALPRIDHGRVHWFLREWKQLDHNSTWMAQVLSRLDKYRWPSS